MLGLEPVDINELSDGLMRKIVELAVKMNLFASENKIPNLSTNYRGYIISTVNMDNVLDFKVFKVSGAFSKIQKFEEDHRRRTSRLPKIPDSYEQAPVKVQAKTQSAVVEKVTRGGNPGPGKMTKYIKKNTD